MANFIEEFFYGNLDPQARSTKQNKDVQKQMEILMNNEEKLTAALDDENKKLFLDFANAWSVVNGESTLDSFIIGFRLGAKFTYDTFIGTDTKSGIVSWFSGLLYCADCGEKLYYSVTITNGSKHISSVPRSAKIPMNVPPTIFVKKW